MKRKILLVVIACILTICMSNASAEEKVYYRWGGFTYYLQDGKAVISNYSVSNAHFESPYGLDLSSGKIQGYEIVGIDSRAFAVVGMLERLTLPDTLEFIGSNAFSNCSYLWNVTFPDSVISIGDSAFSGCTKLEYIELGEGIESIGSNAFYDTAYYNTQENWQDGVLYLDTAAISSLSNVTDIEIRKGTKILANELFLNNTSLKTVILPNELEIIGDYAFRGCSELYDINMPDGLTSIGEYAFYNCKGLSNVTFGSELKELGRYSFFGCSNLCSISFEDSPVRIESGAFYNCSSASISLGNRVISIGDSAFVSCYGITEIDIPDSVTYISPYAFNFCKNLKCINVDVNNSNYLSSDGILYNKDKTEMISYPPAKETVSWVIDESVKTIEANCFFRASNLREIEIGDNVEFINENAFEYASIEKVVIGCGVITIEDYAFNSCKSLKEIVWNAESVENFNYKNYIFSNCGNSGDGIVVTFGDEVKHIPNYLFYGDYSFGNYVLPKITDVKFGNKIETIGAYAFYNCSGLENITIGENVKSIGNYAFSKLTNLKRINWNAIRADDFDTYHYTFKSSGTNNDVEVVFGDAVENIPANLFYDCSFISRVELSESIKVINKNAFYGCSTIEEVNFGKNLENVADYAFYGCSGIEKVSWNAKNAAIGSSTFYNIGKNGSGITALFGDNVEKIPDNLFSSCSMLKKVEMTSSVTAIGDFAFNNCNMLSDLKLSENLLEVGRNAFYGCSSLTEVVLPSKTATIGKYAFGACSSLEEIIIPNEIKYLNEGTFTKCASLEKVILTAVNIIDASAFSDCVNLKHIEFSCDVTRIDNDAFKGASSPKNVYVSNLESFFVMERGNEYSNPLRYGGNLYLDESLVTELVIPEGITTLDSHYLYGCKNIRTVLLPQSLKIIGDHAFAECEALENVDFPAGLEMICENAFYKCISLNKLELPNNLTFIGSAAFYNTSYFTNAENWENGLLYAGDYLIGSMEGESKCFIRENTKLIAGSIFMSGNMCPEEVHITDLSKWCNITFCDVASNPCALWANSLYLNGEKIEILIIPEGVTKIKPYAFFNVKGIYKVVIPEGVTSIGADAFAFIDSLKEIHISKSVEKINEYAFNRTENLETVYYHGNDTDWNDIQIGTYNDVLLNADRVNFYYVDLKSDDGESLRIRKNENDLLNLTDIPTKKEHIFKVYNDSNCTSEYNLSTPINKDMELFLKYIINKYKYKFIDEDGSVIKEETVDYGTPIIPPEIPTKENTKQYTYAFSGWKDYTDSITQTNKEMIFTATYDVTVNQYTYKFLDEDGSVLKEETVDYGTTIIPPEISDKTEYYLFDYWQGYTEGITLTDDITFTAVYKYKDYTITAKGLSDVITVTYNDSFRINPQVKDGFSFIGYFMEKDGNGTQITNKKGESLSAYNVVGDLTLYPYFESVYLNNVELQGVETAMPGDTITQKAIFATDKDASYLITTVKYPGYLNFKSIKGVDFKEATNEPEKVVGDYKYIDITCVFDYDGNFAERNTNYIPFELEFDVATDAVLGSCEISIENVVLIGDDTFDITDVKNHTLTILPKLAESIEIIGSAEIDKATQFTAVVSPDYTTDKSVIWSINDETVAIITQDGTVTPVKNGTVVITATAKDGSKVFATKTVNVIAYAKINSLDFGNGVVWNEFNPDVRKYTVYVKENATSISLTPTFSGGVLRPNGSGVWVSGRSKDFKLNDVETTITLNRENVTDMTDSKYTITIIKFEGTKTKVSENGKSFTITPINIETGRTIILGLYDGEKFVETQTATYSGEEITFTTDKAYTKAKVMVWGDLTNLKPVCSVEELN